MANDGLDSSFELLRRIREGDDDALEMLLHRHAGPLRRWAHGRLPRFARDLEETQDLVQDALLNSLKNLKRFRPEHEGALQAYLRRAVMNRIRDELRRSRSRPPADALDGELPSMVPSPLDAMISDEAFHRYETALAALRPADRDAIVTRLELGLDYDEIATILRKPTAEAARVAVHRAVLKLASRMNDAVR